MLLLCGGSWPFVDAVRVAAPLALFVCACAARAEPRAAHPAPMGTITVSVHRALGPFRPDRTQIVLDGIPVHEGIPVPSVDPLHTVDILVDASIACGLLSSPRATIRVHTVRTVVVTGPAVVNLYVLDSGDPTKLPLSRLSAKWALRDAEFLRSEGYQSLSPLPSPCAGLGPLRRAECRVAAALDEARHRRDVVESLCRDAHLTAIREALPQADAGDASAAATVFRLEREALECKGAEPAWIDQASIVEQISCGVELPEVESPR